MGGKTARLIRSGSSAGHPSATKVRQRKDTGRNPLDQGGSPRKMYGSPRTRPRRRSNSEEPPMATPTLPAPYDQEFQDKEPLRDLLWRSYQLFEKDNWHGLSLADYLGQLAKDPADDQNQLGVIADAYDRIKTAGPAILN